MDYCDAGTLEEVSRIGLPEVMIQQYTAQLATAVSVLHDQGFVHRDIKGDQALLLKIQAPGWTPGSEGASPPDSLRQFM